MPGFIFVLSILFHSSVSIFMPVPYCFEYYCLVVQFENRKCDASRFVLLPENCSGYLGSFAVSCKFRIVFSISVKNAIVILIGITLHLQMTLSNMDILTISIIPIHEHRYPSIYLCLLPFLSTMSYGCQCIVLSPPWLNLLLFVLLGMGLFSLFLFQIFHC